MSKQAEIEKQDKCVKLTKRKAKQIKKAALAK